MKIANMRQITTRFPLLEFDEMQKEASRRGMSISKLLLIAWRMSQKEISDFPCLEDVLTKDENS